MYNDNTLAMWSLLMLRCKRYQPRLALKTMIERCCAGMVTSSLALLHRRPCQPKLGSRLHQGTFIHKHLETMIYTASAEVGIQNMLLHSLLMELAGC